jgi:DNA-binding transcriptional ArsR family regulator
MVHFGETELDAVFTALADPTRRGIVRRLTEGEATLGELARPLPMSLQAVSKHVGVLSRAGIVRTEKRGRERRVRLHGPALRPAAEWMEECRRFWESALDRLAAHVEGAADAPGQRTDNTERRSTRGGKRSERGRR